MLKKWIAWLSYMMLLCATVGEAQADQRSPDGIIPKAQHAIVMDGTLDSWSGAFVTPLNATHPDFYNRATHIYYLWDEAALYIGVRALDTNPTHISPDTALYDGDAVEFYLDTRQGKDLGEAHFGPGTLHMFFTAVTGHELKPRYHIRDLPEFKNFELKGVEIAAAKTPDGYTLEFKLPWSNFPNFKPKADTPIGIDIEMGSADGGHRVHRTFAYSSPTSVGTPSTFGRVLLVDRVDPLAVKAYSRALFPFDAQIPGNYERIYGVACISPTIAANVVRIDGKLVDSAGHTLKNIENASLSTVAGHWRIWRGEWETFDLPEGVDLHTGGISADYALVVTAYDAQNHVLVERILWIALGNSHNLDRNGTGTG